MSRILRVARHPYGFTARHVVIASAVDEVGAAATFPAGLNTLPGLPAATSQQLAETTVDFAGGTIAPIRAQGAHGTIEPTGLAVADALSNGMAAALRTSLLTAVGFLLLGFFSPSDYARSHAAQPRTRERD